MAIDNFRRVDFTLDKANGYIPTDQFAKENDNNGRELTVQITDGGVIKDQSSLVLTLAWKHDTAGNEGQTLFTRLNSGQGIFTVAYDNAMMIPGTVTACIQIADGSRLTNTRNFKLRIEDNPLNINKAVAEDSFTVFVEALAGLTKYDGRIAELENGKADKSTVTADLNKKADKTDLTSLSKTTDEKLTTKRDKNAKIRRSDMDTSTDANKLGLLNLSEEVQAAMAGTAPVIPMVPDGSITNDKIARGTITPGRLSASTQQPIFIASKDGVPNYDTATKTLDFNCVTGSAYFMLNNSPVEVPIGTTVQSTITASGASSAKLVYDSENSEFKFITWRDVLGVGEAMIGGLRLGAQGYTWSGSMPITVDGKQIDQYNAAPNVMFAPSKGGTPNFDSQSRVFDFASTKPTMATLFIGDNVISIPEGTTATPTDSALNNNMLRVVYNVVDNTAQVISWRENVPAYSVTVATVSMNYTDVPLINGVYPYTVDGHDVNAVRNNIDFIPSKGGAPIFDATNNTLDLNAYTDGKPYFIYNNRTYPVPNNTIIGGISGASSFRYIVNLETMEFTRIGWSAPIPRNWIEFAAIRKTNNREVLVTANFPITIKGASFKSLATVNARDAKIIGINHRGFNIVAPEQSKSAYLLSKQNGYYNWECDINWTKDNVPMMIHDLAINRTARDLEGNELPDTVNITDLNYADLANYDFGIVKGERYKGEPLLKFEELLRLARFNDTNLHVEFKYDFTQDQVNILHNLTVKYNMLDRITWLSFDGDRLKPMMELEPNGVFAILGGVVNDAFFEKLASYKTATNTIIASQSKAASVEDIQKIADKGYPIYIWTVNTAADIKKFRDIGMVAGFLTDGTINVADELARGV